MIKRLIPTNGVLGFWGFGVLGFWGCGALAKHIPITLKPYP